MKILITRPIAEAQELAKKLINMGFEPFISPLLEININKDINLEELNRYEALIISSKNAIQAIEKANKNLKLLIVGKQSVNFAKSLGFINSFYMGKNITELRSKLEYNQNLLYLSGNDVTDDLSDLDIKRRIIYQTKILNPNNLINFIKLKQSKACLFFSTRTTDVFIDFINENRLESYCRDISVFSLSDKIANNLLKLEFKSSYIAKEPTLEKLLEEIIEQNK